MKQNPADYYGNNKSRQFVAFLLACLCIFFWGITFVNTKYLSRDFSSLEILVLRFALAYIALWLFKPKVFKTKSLSEEFIFAAAGFTGITFYQFLENISISYTYASNISIIISTCPMFTAIVSQLFLGEKSVTKKFILGFIISIAGIILVTLSGGGNLHISPKGDIIALVAALSWAFYSLVLSRLNSLGYDSALATRRTFFWALVLMIPVILLGKVTDFKGAAFSLEFSYYVERFKNPLNILNIVFLGLGASAFCFFAWSKACAALGTVRTTAGIYFNPVITIIFGAAFLGERLGLRGILGAVLVLAGLFISTR